MTRPGLMPVALASFSLAAHLTAAVGQSIPKLEAARTFTWVAVGGH